MKILITGNMGYVGPAVAKCLRGAHPKAVLHGFDNAYFAHCLTGVSVLPERYLDEQLHPDRPGVSVYVLNMGQPVRIVELAERMIRLSGLQPGYDVEIIFTGIRPGERLNEILFASEEPAVEIGVPGIMAAKPNEPPMQALRKWITTLEQAIANDDRVTIRAVLKDAVPEFGSSAA